MLTVAILEPTAKLSCPSAIPAVTNKVTFPLNSPLPCRPKIAVSLLHTLLKQLVCPTRTLPLNPVNPRPLRAVRLIIDMPVPRVALSNSNFEIRGALKLTPFVKLPTSRTTLTRRDCAKFCLPLTDRQTIALSDIQKLMGQELPNIRVETL